MRRLLLATSLVVAGWAGYLHFTPRPAIDVLTRVPADFPPGSRGGIEHRSDDNLRVAGVPGRHTVVEFYDLRCGGCATLDRDLRDLVRRRPDVAVRRIRVDDDLAKAFGVQRVPHVVIYGASGDVLAEDKGSGKAGLDLLYEWMKAEAGKRTDR
jgi:hypothetical protein